MRGGRRRSHSRACITRLVVLLLLLPQAVQDMCMHKMADKLYERLQQVQWGGGR